MGTRQERAEEKQRHKTRTIVIAVVIVLLLLVGGVGWGVSHQLNKGDKIEPDKSSSSISSKSSAASQGESSEVESSSSSVIDGESSSEVTENSEDETSSSDRAESGDATAHELKMYTQRLAIVAGVKNTVYMQNNRDVPEFDRLVEIPNGFTIYFVNGDHYNIQDDGYDADTPEDLDFFGDKHTWTVYEQQDNTQGYDLEKPSGLGGVYFPTEEELHQYGIR